LRQLRVAVVPGDPPLLSGFAKRKRPLGIQRNGEFDAESLNKCHSHVLTIPLQTPHPHRHHIVHSHHFLHHERLAILRADETAVKPRECRQPLADLLLLRE